MNKDIHTIVNVVV